MRYIHFFILLSIASLYADQPFEPLFVSGGVAPLRRHVDYSSVFMLQSPEQFIQFVIKSPKQTLVYLDSSVRTGHEVDFKKVMAVATAWPRPLNVVSVDAATHMHLVRAMARTARLPSLSLPSVVVFVGGKAVAPAVSINADLERTIAKRIAFARQQERPGSWWQAGVSWTRGLWDKLTQYLFVR